MNKKEIKEFLKSGPKEKVKKNLLLDADKLEKAEKILKKNNKKLSEYVDFCLQELIDKN